MVQAIGRRLCIPKFIEKKNNVFSRNVSLSRKMRWKIHRISVYQLEVSRYEISVSDRVTIGFLINEMFVVKNYY